MNRLDGKVALISGAARGIGAETARLMVEAGAKVAIGDVLDERGRETARTLGGDALYHHLDVTSADDWNAAIAATVGQFGGVDILVNNAGMFLGKGVEDASLDEWHRLVAINMTGVFLGTKLTLPALRERAPLSAHGSAIVNLASIAGLVGSQLDPLYSMTKGGVTLFTKSTALEFARKGYRIRVNSIHPRGHPDRYGRADLCCARPAPRQQRHRGGAQRRAGDAPDRPARRPQRHRQGHRLPRVGRCRFYDGRRSRGRWRADRAVRRQSNSSG